jgi:hypothetical protein
MIFKGEYMRLKNKLYLIIGAIIVLFTLFSGSIFASQLDNVNIDFEKDYYSGIENNPIKINFTIENLNSNEVNLLVYAYCEDEDLECNYSKQFNILSNSTKTTSLNVILKDDGSENLKLFLKDLNNNDEKYFNLNIIADEDNEDGDFDIDISNTSYCRGSTENVTLEFNDVYNYNLYNIDLISDTLYLDLKEDNPIYLTDDKKLVFSVQTNDDTQIGSHKINMKIYNDNLTTYKTFNVYLRDCDDIPSSDFSVIGSNLSNYIIYKDQPITLDYTIINSSNKNKTIFIYAEHENKLNINFTTQEIRLSPGSKKQFEMTIDAKDTSSETDSVKLYFFDELREVTRNLYFQVQPEYALKPRLLQNLVSLKIGNISEIQMILENTGDLLETVDIDYSTSNDLRIDSQIESMSIAPGKSRALVFNISAGPQTEEKTSRIEITLKSRNSDFYEKYFIDVYAFKYQEPLKINFLSFPKSIELTSENSTELSFEIENYSNNDIMLNRIDLINLPEGITYEFEDNLFIPKNSKKLIKGIINVSEIQAQNINSKIIVYDDKGSVLIKSLTFEIINVDEEFEDNKKDEVIPITGFFTLGNSILIGLIFLSLLIIVFYLTGVIKAKHKYPNRKNSNNYN